MTATTCPEGVRLDAYLEARAAGRSSREILGDAEFAGLIEHLSGCAECRERYQNSMADLRGEELTTESAALWAARMGEVTTDIFEDSGNSWGDVAASLWHQIEKIAGQAASVFRLRLEMPSRLVFVGMRGKPGSAAPQRYEFQMDELARGGWKPEGVAWVSPGSVMLELTPREQVGELLWPRVAFRGASGGAAWNETLPAPVQAGDSYLMRVLDLDPRRPVGEQVSLPLDGFVWYPKAVEVRGGLQA